MEAGALVVVAAGGAAFIYIDPRLPSVFSLLFLLAGTVNAAGYIYTLWKQPYVFDEGVHAFTTFTVCAAIGWWYLRSRSSLPRPLRIVAVVAAIGLVLGIAWELFEWAIGIVGDWGDTLLDLAMDMVGAVAAGLFCVWAGRAAARR
ncbi:MAG TPA: hypothetical protein VGR19_09755 [Allosphingosinicella sp.]|nr:hypothetical protein [Allosphingosinicella sp.]